jgi:hypothetical protein
MWAMNSSLQWTQMPEQMPYEQERLNYWGIVTGVFNWRAWVAFNSSDQTICFYNP